MTRDDVLRGRPPEIVARFDIYVDMLLRWQRSINLVAASTLGDLWTRHIGDSLQVQAAVPAARRWVDLGSGGGFPGLVTAILLAETRDAVVHLVESDKRKAAFLRGVSRETGAPAQVHAMRIEAFVAAHDDRVDAVSARALAPLPQLLAFTEKFLLAGATGVFPKGESAEAELTRLGQTHKFAIDSRPSLVRGRSSLLVVRAAPRGGA